jgi:hypothetical protein
MSKQEGQGLVIVCPAPLQSMGDMLEEAARRAGGADLACTRLTALDAQRFHQLHIVVCLNTFAPPYPARFYAVQLEQTTATNSPWFAGGWYLKRLRRAERVYDYSARNRRYLARHGIRARPLRFVPVRAHARDLPAARPHAREVVLYGTINERRRRWIRALRQAGVRLLVVTGVYGPRLRRLLVERARVVVNVHFYANALLEVHRLMECASLGVPVVSEAGINPEERAEHAAVLRAVRFVPVGNVFAMCRALTSLS